MSNPLLPQLCYDVLETYDLRILRIADLSHWKHLSEESSFIDIKTPGSKHFVTNYFRKNKINYYNSNNLELTCETCEDGLGYLPDGIYTIKIYVCEGDKFYYEAKYLRTTKALLRLDKILINLHLACCLPEKKLLEKYLAIDLMIKAAHANLREGNTEQASCQYNKATELLEDFENCTDKSISCLR